MTSSQLPEITLTCGDGHPFTTRAAGGQTVRCKECGRSKHVPASRPRTAKEAAAYIAASAGDHQDQAAEAEPDAGRELAERWNREPEWDAVVRLAAGRAGDECPECSGQLQWDPRRTVTYCPECKRIGLPAVITEHYARQVEQRSEVAIRTAPDKAAERAARARLRALKDRDRQSVDNWLETIADEDCYDQDQWKREARDLASTLRGYLPEIADAEDEAELTEIRQEIAAFVVSDPGRALRTAYDQALERAERQQDARERATEQAARQRELARQQEQEQAEAVQEARRLKAEESRQRKAIASGKQSRPGPAPVTVSPATVTMTDIALAMKAQHERKAKDIEEKGACEFKHSWGQAVASKLFGVPDRSLRGQTTGYAAPNTPQYRACEKHRSDAEKRLNREGYPEVVYWDLPIRQQTNYDYGYDYGF